MLQTRERQLGNVMGLAEEMIVVREERLERILHCLLAVERCVGQEGRAHAQVHLCCSEVQFGAG